MRIEGKKSANRLLDKINQHFCTEKIILTFTAGYCNYYDIFSAETKNIGTFKV